uniref:Uncharacterized protein n=1 Tax=Oryza punctata TaxID=4537 RepID=A0A0E0KKY0_ORYPU
MAVRRGWRLNGDVWRERCVAGGAQREEGRRVVTGKSGGRGSKAEVEQWDCCGSEEAGSGAPLPILGIFLHIAVVVRCRRRRRRRGVARQLVLRGRRGTYQDPSRQAVH